MSTPGLPGPPNVPNILRRQPGESAYSYRQRRSLATTGETLYQRRQRLGQARGMSGREAAGHRVAPGTTEYQIRRERTIQRYGLTPEQLRRANRERIPVGPDFFYTWNQEHGFTPYTTGWTQGQLNRAEPWLQYIWEHSSPQGKITPEMILEARDLEATGALDPEWAYERVYQKYLSLRDYIEARSNAHGRWFWLNDRIPELPAAWWYYHP